jgi:hypothetical protein
MIKQTATGRAYRAAYQPTDPLHGRGQSIQTKAPAV